VNEEVIFAGTDGGGVLASSDNGETWTVVNLNLPTLAIKTLTVAGENIFAGTNKGVFVSKVWVWSVNWVAGSTGLTNTVINNLTTAGDKVYAATNNGVFVSPNTNGVWSAANSGYTDTVNTMLVFNNKLFAGTQRDGLYKSNSITTVSWAAFNTGLNNLETYTLYNSNQLVIAATNKGLFVSRDLAANYTRANKGLTDSLNVTTLSFAGTKLFAGTRYGGVFVSSDTGKTWTSVKNNVLNNQSIVKIITVGMNVLAATSEGTVFITPSAAINWQQTAGLPAMIKPTSLATDGTRVFLGTLGNGIFASTGGTSWAAMNNGLLDINVTSLAVSGTSVFAGTNIGGIFKSDLVGTAWAAANAGLPTKTITSLCATGQWVVAGYKGGAYATFNNGATWLAPNVLLNLPAYADIKDISFSTTSTRIFVATPYNSIYSNAVTELPIATAIDEISNIGHITVSPNPSQHHFNISFNDIKGAVKTINIYDSTGKLVQSIQNEAAQTSLQIAHNYPTGIYFVKVMTSEGFAVQKLIVE
jgi:hypothetical protein